jgi:hypothetical protein
MIPTVFPRYTPKNGRDHECGPSAQQPAHPNLPPKLDHIDIRVKEMTVGRLKRQSQR